MHIEPTREAMATFFGAPPAGPIVMLNLLQFREEARYDELPDLAPDAPISGREAYERYGQLVRPQLAKVGAEVTFRGTAAAWLIGPTAARWDAVLLVRYPSAQAFMTMVSDPDYQAIVGHRAAALEDSRLLPISEA